MGSGDGEFVDVISTDGVAFSVKYLKQLKKSLNRSIRDRGRLFVGEPMQQCFFLLVECMLGLSGLSHRKFEKD